jgi:hypothetical protein
VLLLLFLLLLPVPLLLLPSSHWVLMWLSCPLVYQPAAEGLEPTG